MAVPNGPGTTTLREPWQGPLLDAVLISAFMWWLFSRTDGSASVVLGIVWVILMLGELYRPLRPVAILTPKEILLNGLRPKQIPWDQIRGITTEKRMGAWRVILDVADAPVLMEAPRTAPLGSRKKFDKAVETIRTQWIAHRGANWSAAEARPAEGGPAES